MSRSKEKGGCVRINVMVSKRFPIFGAARSELCLRRFFSRPEGEGSNSSEWNYRVRRSLIELPDSGFFPSMWCSRIWDSWREYGRGDIVFRLPKGAFDRFRDALSVGHGMTRIGRSPGNLGRLLRRIGSCDTEGKCGPIPSSPGSGFPGHWRAPFSSSSRVAPDDS